MAAKEKKDNKDKKDKTEKAGKANPGLSLAVICIVILGLVSLPAMLLLLIGMLPTLGAFMMAGGGGRGAQALSVAFMNFAGCFPFLLKIIVNHMGFDKGIELIADPLVLVTIYATAGTGYIVDAFLSGYISTFLYSRAQVRLSQIEERQKELEQRWGPEVTGKIPLDEEGFPLPQDASRIVKKGGGR